MECAKLVIAGFFASLGAIGIIFIILEPFIDKRRK